MPSLCTVNYLADGGSTGATTFSFLDPANTPVVFVSNDLSIYGDTIGTTAAATLTAVPLPVPEPSAFAALGLGAVALLRRRRR